MNFTHEFAKQFRHAGDALRTELNVSLERSPRGAWWIPSIAACVLCGWLANRERKRA